MIGFRLSELIVSGSRKEDARISFGAGCNILTGPSNTGKSYIVECLDFILGGETIPGEDIEESKGYDTAFLEIVTYDKSPLTLERSLSGGDVRLYESFYADRSSVTPRIISVETQTKKNETLSAFLLKLMGVQDVKVRTNANGELGNLTFRMISHLFVVDETSIIAKKRSPVRLVTGFAKTSSERAFNYLLTGQDDHTIITLPSPKEEKAKRQGRRDLYDELIAALEKRVEGVAVEDVYARLEEVDELISKTTESLSAKTATIHQYQLSRQAAFEKQYTSESRLIVIAELLQRFDLLKQHYASDLERLEFISEGEFYFDQLIAMNCPVCGASLDNHSTHKLTSDQEATFGSVQSACRVEGDKIRAHLADLGQTIEGLVAEREGAEASSKGSRAEIDRVDKMLADEVRPVFESERVELDGMIERRKGLSNIENAFASLQAYRAARTTLDEKQKTEKAIFADLDIAAARKLCDVIQDLLREWKFIGASEIVEFNDKKMDIVVSGKHRQSNGKGLRGFLHGAFTLGLMRYCRTHTLPHTGFIILDSPITSYREGKTDEAEDEATPEVQSAFWDHLAQLPTDEQVIIIENKEPTESAKASARYIHFSGPKSTEGRKGFFPPNG